MRNAILLASPIVFMALGTLDGSPSAREGDAAIIIRTYNYAAVEGPDLDRARQTAGLIFSSAGIALRWTDCRIPGSDGGASCTEPLSDGREFVLRLMASLAASSTDRRVALGESVLDRRRGGGILMTIDPQLVQTIARNSGADSAPLLGRAIAHELGHLVLGVSEHPRTGLMRAFWSSDEIRGIRPTNWRFSSREAAQMRRGLLIRARPAN